MISFGLQVRDTVPAWEYRAMLLIYFLFCRHRTFLIILGIPEFLDIAVSAGTESGLLSTSSIPALGTLACLSAR